MDNYFKIGRLVATFGLSGEVVLQHSLGKRTSLKGLESVFIEESNDSYIPYFIESAKIKNEKEVYIKFEGVNSKESARKLTPKDIWIPEESFRKFAGSSAPISLLGFTMVNDDEELGEVLEVIEQPHQVLCKLMIGGNEVLIPVHQDSLLSIDKKNRKIFVTLPDGLLEIYSSSSEDDTE
ncbi:MAG: 16S rRNA processing protein RimM [Chitinophagaceae bacterium]|nr:16S rRNA processing protein RimM [Chitinophagaceae bacterium]